MPDPVPPSLFVDAEVSRIVSSSTRFSPSVPFPLPVLAVTVYTELETLVTEAIEAPLTPPACTSVKSAVLTPVTALSKVTVQETLVALVGLALTRLIEETVGGVTVIPFVSVREAVVPVPHVLLALDALKVGLVVPAAVGTVTLKVSLNVPLVV